jgi:hypothetical protein
VVFLTAKGENARNTYFQLVTEIEDRWQARFGKANLDELRKSLEHLVCHGSSLLDALVPYPEGWRASLPKLSVLPHYPMVLHRGGFPDGS